MVHRIGTMDTCGYGYPAIGRNIITNGFMAIMCAPANGIANTSANATMTVIMITAITTMIITITTNITRTKRLRGYAPASASIMFPACGLPQCGMITLPLVHQAEVEALRS
jgi:hypothetical protein